MFKLATVPDGHANRFRDTLAVELLLAGVPLERVSVLLGHQSVKVTDKHSTPWVRARQEQLEQDARRTWNTELIALTETKGTPEYTRMLGQTNLMITNPDKMVEAAGVELFGVLTILKLLILRMAIRAKRPHCRFHCTFIVRKSFSVPTGK